MLAAKAMLTGIGVGSNTATVGAALWQTTVRRNIGKVARIFFVTFKGTGASLPVYIFIATGASLPVYIFIATHARALTHSWSIECVRTVHSALTYNVGSGKSYVQA
jgi:hypothetical protein